MQGDAVSVGRDGQRGPYVQAKVSMHDVEARRPVTTTGLARRLEVSRRAKRGKGEQLELKLGNLPQGFDLVADEAPPHGVPRARVEIRDYQGAHGWARLAGSLCPTPLGKPRLADPPGPVPRPPPRMRIWFDMTAYAHPVGILDRYGMDYMLVGRHAGASRSRKVVALVGRTTRLHRWARGSFDLAVAHGS